MRLPGGDRSRSWEESLGGAGEASEVSALTSGESEGMRFGEDSEDEPHPLLHSLSVMICGVSHLVYY